MKAPPKIEIEDELTEEKITEFVDEIEKLAIEDVEIETELEAVSEENSIPNEEVEESTKILNPPLNASQNLEKSTKLEIIDVPEEFEDPQKEAEEWFYKEKLAAYEKFYNEAKRLSKEETDELKAAQWGIRASVARYNIEELKLWRKKSK